MGDSMINIADTAERNNIIENETDKSNIIEPSDKPPITNMERSGKYLKITYSEDVPKELRVEDIDEGKLNELSYVIDNKESFLKCGVELLTLAIEVHNLHLMEKIYNKCINYFEKDITNNKMFLNIITSAIPLLDEYYPEYITRYSLDTDMIIDSPPYIIERNTNSSHLYSFSKPHKPRRSTPFSLYDEAFRALIEFQVTTKSIPKITFMVPYIKFANYPQKYNWWKEFILPQPSLFVKSTNCEEIYKTWGGEALINFKWNAYGIFYFIMIWTGNCIIIACVILNTIPVDVKQLHDLQKNYRYALIVLAIIYLSIEVRKFVYMLYNWGRNIAIEQRIGNVINIIMYSIMVYTSFKQFQTDENYDGILSFVIVYLFLKYFSIFKFALFYGKHYVILVNVGKRVFLFLLFFVSIIIIGFTMAFSILLAPKLPYSLDERTINNDPNNPWNIVPTYQAFENQNENNVNLYIIQHPDENTNMFSGSSNPFFATFLLLTGDTSALPYQNNGALKILIVLFISLTVIFVLNVFIGLFSEAMNFDVETSMLIMKAKFLAEVEMIYLFPNQRRWKKWFPKEVLYYHADINKTRKKINQMIDNKKWNTDKFPEMKQNLLKILNIKNPQDNDALLQELLKKIKKLENGEIV